MAIDFIAEESKGGKLDFVPDEPAGMTISDVVQNQIQPTAETRSVTQRYDPFAVEPWMANRADIGQTAAQEILGTLRLEPGELGRLQPPPTAGQTEKIASGVANALLGAGESMADLRFAAAAPFLAYRLPQAIAGGVFGGLAAKQAGQLAGEAAGTGDLTKAGEAAGTGLLSGLISTAPALYKPKGQTYAPQERQIQESRVGEHPGVPQGTDVRPYGEEIRKGEGERPGYRRGNDEGGAVPPQQAQAALKAPPEAAALEANNPPSIAQALGMRFDGIAGDRALYTLVTESGKPGTTIALPKNATVEQAQAKYEAKLKEYEGESPENKPRPPRDWANEDMLLAHRLVRMSPEGILAEAPSFNTINVRLGDHATPDMIAELKDLSDMARERATKARENYAKNPQDPNAVNEFSAAGNLEQFYNEAVRRKEPNYKRSTEQLAAETKPAAPVRLPAGGPYGGETASLSVHELLAKGSTVGGMLSEIGKGKGAWSDLARQLGKIADQESLGVKVQRSPEGGRSFYDPTTDSISMLTGQSDVPTGIIIHEVLHGLTAKKLPEWLNRVESLKLQGDAYIEAIRKGIADPETIPAAKSLLEVYLRAVERHPDERVRAFAGNPDSLTAQGLHYGLGSPFEFVAEAFSRRDIQQWMDSVPGIRPRQTLWQSFVDAVRGMIGLPARANSLLYDALQSGAELVAAKRPGVEPTGRRLQAPEIPPTKPPGPPTTLEDVYSHFEPEPKKFTLPIGRWVSTAVEATRTGLLSKFRPLDKFAEDINKAYGGAPKRLASIFEQVVGSSGKAASDVYDFDRNVSDLVKGKERDFNAYMFLRRSLDRLNADMRDIQTAMAGGDVETLNRRRVAQYTINQLTPKLELLLSKLDPETRANFEKAANGYQVAMDNALKLQVESGRMPQEVYDNIKAGNQFYAPFKMLKYLDESTRPEGTGRKIDTIADYTKAITGIDDPNFKLGDMLQSARQNITISRILADKNSAMLKFSEVADQDVNGLFVRRLKSGEKAQRGYEAVNVLKDGDLIRYEVDPDVAQAVRLYNTSANSVLSKFLRTAAVPFRTGATTANAAFQIVNLLLADAPRASLIAKTGVRSPIDLVRYPLDFVQAMYSAMLANVGGIHTKLYTDYLRSGAANSTIQSALTPELLRFHEPTVGTKSGQLMKSVIAKIPEFSNAIEETHKVLGIKRALRITGAESGTELQKRFPEWVTEVRRFSGSPDFWRLGRWTDAARLNLIYMFFNARVQGAALDLGRLGGADGAATAAKTWAKMGVAIGIPTAALYYYNHLPQYEADYNQRPSWERDNYWLIPKDNFLTDEYGNKIRDYWRIPKRESAQILANLVESALDFSRQADPQAFWAFSENTLENLSPLNIRGQTFQERLESTVSSLNPLMKAPIEAASGRELFRHRDIVPESMRFASPEEQYRDTTPDVYKKLARAMPDVAPEALRSPLMLENLVQNLSANLVNQFLPRKAVKGREDIPAALQPILRRFESSPVVDTEKVRDQINLLKRESADEFLARDRKARSILDKTDDINEAAKQVGADEKLMKRTVDLWLARKNNVTPVERQVISLPPEQRAKYVADKLKGLDSDAKLNLLVDFTKKRILTDDTMTELLRIIGPEGFPQQRPYSAFQP